MAFGLPVTNLSLDYAGDIVRRGIRLEGVAGREIFRSWYKMESLLKSGAVNPRPAITHTFALQGLQESLRPDKFQRTEVREDHPGAVSGPCVPTGAEFNIFHGKEKLHNDIRHA